jgi:hypothetical protein
MKKISILLILITLYSSTNAQIIDNQINKRFESIEKLTNELKESNITLTNNLDRYQKNRKTGIAFLATGFFMSVFGYSILLASSDFDDSVAKKGSKVLFYTGGVCSFTGGIITLDSGKWIRNRKRVNPNFVPLEKEVTIEK